MDRTQKVMAEEAGATGAHELSATPGQSCDRLAVLSLPLCPLFSGAGAEKVVTTGVEAWRQKVLDDNLGCPGSEHSDFRLTPMCHAAAWSPARVVRHEGCVFHCSAFLPGGGVFVVFSTCCFYRV